MPDYRSGRALAVLLRFAMFGITQGVAVLVSLVLFMCGAGPDLIILGVLVCAVVGIEFGRRATRPRR